MFSIQKIKEARKPVEESASITLLLLSSTFMIGFLKSGASSAFGSNSVGAFE